MAPWVLLLLTVGCAWLCLDAFAFKGPVRDKHPPTAEGRTRMLLEAFAAPFGLGVLAWLLLAMTVLWAALTVREFLS